MFGLHPVSVQVADSLTHCYGLPYLSPSSRSERAYGAIFTYYTLEVMLERFSKDYVILRDVVHLHEEEEGVDRRT